MMEQTDALSLPAAATTSTRLHLHHHPPLRGDGLSQIWCDCGYFQHIGAHDSGFRTRGSGAESKACASSEQGCRFTSRREPPSSEVRCSGR